jgi:hypothetical protein
MGMAGPAGPFHLVTALEANGEQLSCGQCGPARCFHRGINLRQRQPGMVEKGLACGGQSQPWTLQDSSAAPT